MTGPRRLSHDVAEELISASLTGDLTDAESADLAAHLAACERCTATAAAWADSRRLLSGIRHVAAPRDLGARVRAGVEGGRLMDVPWYRRPAFAMASVGALAAAALVMAIVIGMPDGPPPVGSSSPLPSGVTGSPSPSESPSGSASATPPAPSATEPAGPLAQLPPDYRVEYAFDVPGDITRGTTVKVVDQATGEAVRTLTPGNEIFAGTPTEARLSPDGSWLALRLLQEMKGTELLYAVQLDGDAVVALGETLPDPFAAAMHWSPGDGRYLAYTLVDTGEADGANGAADVFIFEPPSERITRLTATGGTYAGSWAAGGGDTAVLWVSLAAGPRPTSYTVTLRRDQPVPADINPATDTTDQFVVDDVFAPLWSPNGSQVLFWSGAMEATPFGWQFVGEGGVPKLGVVEDTAQLAARSTPVFAGYPDGLASARMTWNPSSNAYAIWAASGSDDPAYPDETRVYFAAFEQRTDPLLDATRALDVADVPDGGRVIDVALAPDARHLALTVAYPIPGDLAQPVAELILVTRNYGDEADVTQTLGPSEVWVGPAIYATGPP